jgi:hypothetical protein
MQFKASSDRKGERKARDPKMEEHQYSAEELAEGRRADAAIQASADRVFGSPRPATDQVSIELDWGIPTRALVPIVFKIRINRGSRGSVIRCAIDLDRLPTGNLQILHDLLANPPKGYWLARGIAWLIDTSLRQQQPRWSTEQRNRKVRELLLAPP